MHVVVVDPLVPASLAAAQSITSTWPNAPRPDVSPPGRARVAPELSGRDEPEHPLGTDRAQRGADVVVGDGPVRAEADDDQVERAPAGSFLSSSTPWLQRRQPAASTSNPARRIGSMAPSHRVADRKRRRTVPQVGLAGGGYPRRTAPRRPPGRQGSAPRCPARRNTAADDGNRSRRPGAQAGVAERSGGTRRRGPAHAPGTSRSARAGRGSASSRGPSQLTPSGSRP